MSFEFFNPWVFVGVVAVVLVVIATRWSFAGLGPVQGKLHLTLRVLMVLALLGALSGITREHAGTREGSVALLVMPREPSQAAQDFAAKAKAAAGPRDDVRLMAPAERTTRSLGETLDLAPSRIPEGACGRVVLVGGVESIDAPALTAARRLAKDGIPVDVVVEEDVPKRPAVVAVQTRGEVRSGIPFELAATVAGAVSQTAVEFREPGPQERTIKAEAGTTPDFVARDELTKPGPHLFSVTLSNPGNEAARSPGALLPVWVRPALKVLIVRDAGVSVDHLARALGARGMKTETTDASALPANGPEWTDYDAVVLVNVTADELGDARQETLRRYVFDGGGLVMAGGPKSFGCGGYYHTAVEKALPAYMDPLREPPSYALVVVMDKSWSMGDAVAKSIHKVDLVREVSIAATTPMTSHDFFGLISFDSQPHVIVELRNVKDRKLITKTISTLGAFGTTNFYRAMSKAFELLKETKATYKHIVLLSDGRSSVPNLNYQTLVADMTKKRVTISTVGVGADCHRQLLADMAAWGKGRNYHVAGAVEIPQVLLEESNKMKEILTVEVPSAVKVVTKNEMLSSIDVGKAPKLLGFNRVRAKESAETVLSVSTKDEPLLCLWHYGTGRAAAFATDASARWSADWIDKWPEGYARLWQETVASVVSVAPAGDAGIRWTRSAGRHEVLYEAVDSWGRPVTGMTLKAEALRPRGDGWETASLTLSESGPGLYRAELPTRPTPPCLLRVTDATGRTHAVRSLALTAPRPMTNEERLGRAGELARAGAGRVNPGPADIFESDATPTVRRASIRPVMLLTALVLLLLDIIVRRYAAIVRLFVRRQ